jgi:hypothetical protein
VILEGREAHHPSSIAARARVEPASSRDIHHHHRSVGMQAAAGGRGRTVSHGTPTRSVGVGAREREASSRRQTHTLAREDRTCRESFRYARLISASVALRGTPRSS